MSEDRDRRLAGAAARARAAMTAGATLDDVLRTFRDDEQLGAIEAIKALRELAPMDLSCAKLFVSSFCEGRSYAHLTLSDLELLGDMSHVEGVDYFTRRHHEDAIIRRKPYLLYVRDLRTSRSVLIYVSATPLAAEPMHSAPGETGWISGDDVTFERICDDARRAAAAWPSGLRIVRDEPDQMLLHFIRAPSA
jgi:hypothetical protein